MSGFKSFEVKVIFILNVILLNSFAHAQPVDKSVSNNKESESFLNQGKSAYLDNEDITKLFNDLEDKYPDIVKSYSIGKSVENRNLNAISLTAAATSIAGGNGQERNYNLKPLVKMVANINGDEVLGRQIIIYFAQYLCENYNTLPEVQKLLNTTEIHLLPSVNPDGFAKAKASISTSNSDKEGNCESLPNFAGRTNAAGVDLNRDFPDRLESQQTIQAKAHGRQPETAAMIEWILSKPFVLSANFHGGAVVASYPYDNSLAHRECCEDSLTPDDHVFKLMAHTYSDNHPLMRKGNSCNETFAGGITNGANWYELNGGMQDFNYAFSNCFELTIELSCCKYPTAATLPTEWARNKRSLMSLLKLAHIGIKGLVKDANGYPIHDASIVVSGLEDKPIRTTKRGEYWRLLTPGVYSVQAVAFGYQPSPVQQVNIVNQKDEAVRLDFTLLPVETNFDGKFRKINSTDANSDLKDDHDKYGFLTPTKFEHHNFTAMEKVLKNIAESYPSITRMYSIGKSVQDRDLWVMEITTDPGKHIPGKPEFKYVANMHGNEVVGKEMLLLLTKYLCERYMVDPRVTKMVNNTRLHFLYSMNPDGYEIASPNATNNMHGRSNANDVDLNRNFPDQYGSDKYNMVTEPEVSAVMNWTLSIPFVLSANLHGGSLVANYPFDDNENDFLDPIARLRIATKTQRKANPTDDNELFKHLALTYSQAHPTMHLGHPCPQFKHETFPDGITNGAQWYSVTGGMQDWNYVKAGVIELTIEMGCTKFPEASELPQYWLDNKEPLLRYIEQIHNGVHGYVRSSIGTPVMGALITLDDSRHSTYSGSYGDYWRLALPGRHNITIVADGFAPQREEIEIDSDGASASMIFDVALMRDDPQHWASAYDYRIIENVVHTKYHTNGDLMTSMAELENRHGQIAAFSYADNEFGTYFKTLKLTSDIGEPEETKFKILIMSSFFDTAGPLTREITMNLVRHIIEGYKLHEPKIVNLLQKSILYFLPVTENFDKVFRIYNQNTSICDPVIGEELADRLLGPEADKPKDLLLKFLDNERFDLMLTFTAGNSELSYPKSNKIFEKFAHDIENTEFTFSPLKCSSTSTRSLHFDLTQRLTNLFLNFYNIPMFSLGLSCCQMPKQTEIASIWRKNLEKMKNFLSLIETGVVGQVQNNKGQPLRTAFIRFMEYPQVYNVTKNTALFQIILPEGDYSLEISAPNYETNVERIQIKHGHVLKMGIIKLNDYSLVTGKSEITPLGKQANQEFGSSSGDKKTINGYILDELSHPIRNAKVSIVTPKNHESLRNFTDSFGAYILKDVPVGEVTFKVEAPRHESVTRVIHVTPGRETTKDVVFYLKKDEHVMGMPRLLFIAVASVLIIGGVVLCIICVQCALAHHNRADKPYYNFSLLPQKGKDIFDEDLGDDGETELFRSPIKRGMSIKPYYDDDNVEHVLNSDDDEEDNEHDFVDDSGDEIVMLEKRK